MMKDEYSVTEFKATCLRIIEHIRTTGMSVVVTKNGKPAVRVIPASSKKKKDSKLFGSLKSDVVEVGDILSPLGTTDWDVLK